MSALAFSIGTALTPFRSSAAALFFARLIACFTACLGLLGGCAVAPDPALGTLIGLSAGGLVQGTPRPAQPDPQYRYLRAQVQGYPPAMLALAYLEPDLAGTVEVWVSARREVLRIQNGRVVATVGLPNDWSATRFSPAPPPWGQVSTQKHRFFRIHDESKGYRTDLMDTAELLRWTQVLPPEVLEIIVPSLPLTVAQSYTWHRESYRSDSAQTIEPSWFAWGTHRGIQGVVFSYQCLGAGECVTLQAWPPEVPAQ